MRIPKQPFGEAHMERNGLLLTAPSEPFCKWVLQAKQSLEMTTAQANILTATLWDTLHQNHPAQSLLNSWRTDITWDNKCRLSFLIAGCWGKLIHLLSQPPPLSSFSYPPTHERQTPPASRMDYLSKRNQIPVLLWSEPSDGFMSLRIKPSVFSVADEVLYHPVLATLLSSFPALPWSTLLQLQRRPGAHGDGPHLWDFALAVPSAPKAVSPGLCMPSSLPFFQL